MQQRPTCIGLCVRSTSDAHVILHAVHLGLLQKVARRLDTEERRSISSGNIFVWEERGATGEPSGIGIERWTDSIRWGPSRVRDEFLFYQERETPPIELDTTSDSDATSPSGSQYGRSALRDHLIKQTYSVFVDTAKGYRKWHLIAYFTKQSMGYLRTIDDIPELARLRVPPGLYKSAKLKPLRHEHGRRPPQAKPPYPPCPGRTPEVSLAPFPSPIDPHPIKPVPDIPQPGGAYNDGRRAPPSGRGTPEILAPLMYLQNIAPACRHPVDERALMSFTTGFT